MDHFNTRATGVTQTHAVVGRGPVDRITGLTLDSESDRASWQTIHLVNGLRKEPRTVRRPTRRPDRPRVIARADFRSSIVKIDQP